MSTETLERLPNTVTKCHAEIKKLREIAGADSADRIVELEAERDELKAENDALEARIEELEENEHPDVVEAVDRFLDECERVGPMRYDVPQSDHAMRAIVGLHDAIGRAP